MKIAVCLHLYHTDMIDEITSYLSNLKTPYDLFITIVKNYPLSFLNHLRRITKNVNIIIVENRGMDIGGFLSAYKEVDESYDIVLKLHTKKSLGSDTSPSLHRIRHGYESAKNYGKIWFNDLMNGVLGSEEKVSNIISEFKKNDKCGMVGNRISTNFKKNEVEMQKIFDILGITNNYTESKFIGGTVFWFKNSIYKKYLTNQKIDEILSKMPLGYVSEPSPNHAMERIFGCLVYKEGMEIIKL